MMSACEQGTIASYPRREAPTARPLSWPIGLVAHEPSLQELLDDPLIQIVMASDGVARDDVVGLAVSARSRLRVNCGEVADSGRATERGSPGWKNKRREPPLLESRRSNAPSCGRSNAGRQTDSFRREYGDRWGDFPKAWRMPTSTSSSTAGLLRVARRGRLERYLLQAVPYFIAGLISAGIGPLVFVTFDHTVIVHWSNALIDLIGG